MDTSIYVQLQTYLAGEMLKQPSRAIAPDEPIISSGLVDSFHLVDLALFVEDTFGVRIDDTELNAATFDTLAQLTALVETRRPA
ncbi:MAG TPA: acyl carrier protein [Levilinea sp.]|nr:acyl carrier protein [Levilinea sp.]